MVCFCGIGGRSGKFAASDDLAQHRNLAAGGVIRNLAGSTMAWAHAGLPFVDTKTGLPTKRVHGTSAEWAVHYPQKKGYDVVLPSSP